MSGELEIRDARESDKKAAIEATLASYAEYENLMPPEIFEGYMTNIKRTVAGEAGPVEHIVAVRDEKIVGSVLIIPEGTVVETPEGSTFVFSMPEVRLLAVVPSERGKGTGRALMEECIRRVRDAGSPVLSLHSLSWMKPAMALYESMGFVHTPEADSEPGPGVVVKAYRMDFGG